MKWMLPMACLLVAVTPLSYAATVRADKLPAPKNMTCLQMTQAMSYTIPRGLLHIPWGTELGRGAYISEHEDAHGIYYRAPAGAITERRTDEKETSVAGRRMTFEGGIYVPNDTAAAPSLYKYYGTDTGATRSAPDNTDCTTLTYTVDPQTHKVNVWALGAATGIGAATGMAIGHSIHPQMHGSYGQAAGAGLIGGLIGGLIVGAIENSKVGEIIPGPALDGQTGEKIRALATDKVAMTERGQPGVANVAMTAPVALPVQTAMAQAGAEGDAPTSIGPATSSSVAGPTTATPSIGTIAMVESPTTSQAQGVANQLGCGVVKASGAGGYVAPCGSYGVYIDCDSGRCHPAHTVKLEDAQ
ncbi:hypothetical protein [Dyella sp. 20L07]|uniref:hypothetical protein n=1 Tax=Dyella sp. 20L07 TaxID=3384240 RepID=UPI003D27721A